MLNYARQAIKADLAATGKKRALTTTPDHNETGQQPIRADGEEADSQASDGNR
jgi:hypothetical protein